MPSLCIHVPNCIWTKALLDGAVKVDGFDVDVRAGGIRLSAARDGCVAKSRISMPRTEQVIPDYLVRIARGTENDLVAAADFRDPRHGAAKVRHAAR